MLTASYAKINLHLEISGKLPNNYHQVNTVLCGIDLCDYISYHAINKPEIRFSCSDPELDNQNNLIYKIASYLQKELQVNQGMCIHLDKKIPVAAGLGGGSGNAANCLLNLNKLWELGLSDFQLHSLAAEFGSDINYFLLGGTARGTNRGEQISPLPYLHIENILLVNPGLKISAAEAYRLVKLPAEHEIVHFDPDNWQETGFNRLQPGIRSAYPQIDDIISYLSNHGGQPAMLSGSGSTCFGIFSDIAAMQQCQAYFAQMGYWTQITKTIPAFL